MGRAPCCDKTNVKKGPWSPQEDAKLKAFIDQNGIGGNWISLPQKIGLQRCGKSCRLRWLNYLRPNLRHGGFSSEEDNIICSLYLTIGSRWSIIAAQLPGRTDNDIKNHWNTKLKKLFFGKQREKQRQAQRVPIPIPIPCLEQHVDRGISSAAANIGHQNNPCVSFHNPDLTLVNDHASIRNQLQIGNGGQVLDGNLQDPLAIFFTNHHLYSSFITNSHVKHESLPVHSENSVDGFSISSSGDDFNDANQIISVENLYDLQQTSVDLLQRSSIFHGGGFDNCSRQGLDGWECLYGVDMINSGAMNFMVSTNGEEVEGNCSSSFALVYPDLISQNKSCQQWILQGSKVESGVAPFITVREGETVYGDGETVYE